ncbi:MAG TPA: hypothetical protein VHN78_16055, partial [Chloroflexota bacterium]|nr:hypothetical protein [Chloroflexota bacterium]
MADDLNGDKLLAACRVAGDPSLAPNPLLAWLERAAATAAPAEPTRPTPPSAAPPAVDVGRQLRQLPFPLQTVAAHATQCLATIAAVEQASGGSPPTARQAEAIGSRLAEAALLIQGPPGSGKSHTLGWAILVRLAAARLAGATSYRVAVSSKT